MMDSKKWWEIKRSGFITYEAFYDYYQEHMHLCKPGTKVTVIPPNMFTVYFESFIRMLKEVEKELIVERAVNVEKKKVTLSKGFQDLEEEDNRYLKYQLGNGKLIFAEYNTIANRVTSYFDRKYVRQ